MVSSRRGRGLAVEKDRHGGPFYAISAGLLHWLNRDQGYILKEVLMKSPELPPYAIIFSMV